MKRPLARRHNGVTELLLPSSGTVISDQSIDQKPATSGCIMVPVEPTEAADTAKVLFECAQNKDRFGKSQAAFVAMHGCLHDKRAVFIACWHRSYVPMRKR